ncbi:MAG: VCBS repeat-containing protein [Pirellulaceae bacterium]|nr:VCBS repeat-containing protein [Pirellulaceae bacterium]
MCLSFRSAVTIAIASLVLTLTNGTDSLRAQDSAVPFSRVTIDDTPPARPWYKMLGDIDADGSLDIIIAGAKGPLVWYGYPDWTKSEIAAGGWNGVKGAIGDVDRDGDVDIVMGGVVWFSNPGAAGRKWKMTRIDTRTAHDVELADLDRDGRLDVVARDQSAFGKSGNVIYVYRQNSPTSWDKHTIDCPHGEGLKLADLDGDQDTDIVIGGLWYENTGRADRWLQNTYTTNWTEPDAKVEVADLNGDGRLDIVLTPAELKGQRYKVAWYEAPADAKDREWLEHIIVRDIECVIHSLAVGDIDRDGDVDVAIAEMHQGENPDEVTVHLNCGKGKEWSKQLLSNDGSHDIILGDIDGDGDLDIVGANHGGESHPVELWRNKLADPSS